MLVIRDLTIKIGNRPIIQNFDQTLKKGEILGIWGANGTGKSTLCRAVSGLLKEGVTGSIEIGGKNLWDMTVAERVSNVGIIFQDPEAQLFSPTVVDEIAFAPENLCLKREEIYDRIKQVVSSIGIEHLLNRKTNSLSGGEKQLVAIASVVAMRPRVLIADEITAHIDNTNKNLVHRVLLDYAKEGAVIFAAPTQSELSICTRTFSLNKNEYST